MIKLKTTQVKQYRLELLKQQGYKCALCSEHCSDDQAVLDHCHSTGKIRGVLHRGCNALEGKIANSLKMNKIDEIRLRMIALNLVDYMSSTLDVLHPTHKTPEEKKLAAKKRAKRRRNASK